MSLLQALKPLGIGVATGEMCCNRVMFKQFLQAGAMQYCQIDSCRIGGVNEVLSVYFMAKKLGGLYHYCACILLLCKHAKESTVLGGMEENVIVATCFLYYASSMFSIHCLLIFYLNQLSQLQQQKVYSNGVIIISKCVLYKFIFLYNLDVHLLQTERNLVVSFILSILW
jgi:hypothetical protein